MLNYVMKFLILSLGLIYQLIYQFDNSQNSMPNITHYSNDIVGGTSNKYLSPKPHYPTTMITPN